MPLDDFGLILENEFFVKAKVVVPLYLNAFRIHSISHLLQ